MEWCDQDDHVIVGEGHDLQNLTGRVFRIFKNEFEENNELFNKPSADDNTLKFY